MSVPEYPKYTTVQHITSNISELVSSVNVSVTASTASMIDTLNSNSYEYKTFIEREKERFQKCSLPDQKDFHTCYPMKARQQIKDDYSHRLKFFMLTDAVELNYGQQENTTPKIEPTKMEATGFPMLELDSFCKEEPTPASINDNFRSKKRPLSSLHSPDKADNEDYWVKRRKNNESAKRSRDARRNKEENIALRVAWLQQQNIKYQNHNKWLAEEVSRLREICYSQQPPM